MHKTFFRTICFFMLLVLAACSSDTGGEDPHNPVETLTHFRQGSLTYVQTGPTSVNFTSTNSFRRSSYVCRALPSGAGTPCTGPGGNPGVGDYIREDIGLSQINFGDGDSTPVLFYVVDAIDVDGDWLLGRALNPGTTDPFIPHDYANAGPFTAALNSCCRTGTEINNPFNNYIIEATVNLSGNTGNPVSSLPAIVNCQVDSVCTFTVPAIDPDGDAIDYRFSTFAESGIADQPGPPDAPNAATISASGVYTWDTTGATMAPSGETLYSTQVTLETANDSTAVDFLIRIVEENGNNPPAFDYPPTPTSGANFTIEPGENLNFPVQASDPDAGDTVEIDDLGLPAGATLTCGAPANPQSCTFDWTPAAGDIGVYAITFIAEDNNGNNSGPTSVTIEVEEDGTQNDPPVCEIISIEEGPPVTLNVFTQDTDDGLASITIIADENADVMIPAFDPGTNDPVMVVAEKIDSTQKSRVELEVTDVAGNAIRCDPVIVNLEIEAGNTSGSTSVNVTGIPEVEGQVNVSNGTPGASVLSVRVNSGETTVLELADGEVVDYDASADMHPGDNSAAIAMQGEPGSSAMVMFHDGSASGLAGVTVIGGLSTQGLGASTNLDWY